MAFIVVYDACVLFPAPLRDLLIRGVVRETTGQDDHYPNAANDRRPRRSPDRVVL